MSTPLQITDRGRVRTLTLNRPDALNAFNEALYDACADALLEAAEDPTVAVVVITGAGRAFSAGTDLLEMARMNTDPDFQRGRHGFPGLVEALAAFPKPLICAINGLGLGIGTTIIGFADLVFMSSAAELKCPFTSLGVAPEAASSYLMPNLVGRQNAAWLLLSAEWVSAAEAREMGLAWKVTDPEALMEETYRYADVLASRPISSLRHVKAAMAVHHQDAVKKAFETEAASFVELMGGPANMEALTAFAEGREPDFTQLPPGW